MHLRPNRQLFQQIDLEIVDTDPTNTIYCGLLRISDRGDQNTTASHERSRVSFGLLALPALMPVRLSR